MSERIPVAGPWITQREIDYLTDAGATAWGPHHYDYNARFEATFASYVGVRHAVSLPHCTSAIHLALAGLGIGPGDEVIVPDVTWIASVAPVLYVGAEPVFADIDPVTWCLDPVSVETCITPRTKAIIGVDLYGSMADWPRLRALADAHGLALIEDAAEAVGSGMNNCAAGSLGDAGVFSFHGSKTVVTGEGGMLVTDDTVLYERVQKLRDHGRPPGDRFFLNEEVAFKYKMSAFQAAVGLAQIERIEELIEKKRQIFRWYQQHLNHRTDLVLNAEPAGTINSYWMVTIIPRVETGIDKFELMKRLDTKGIDTRPFFSRLSQIPAFADKKDAARFLPKETQGAHAARCGVNLPSGFSMDEPLVRRVADAIDAVLPRQ